jgi:hypothetical protein
VTVKTSRDPQAVQAGLDDRLAHNKISLRLGQVIAAVNSDGQTF